VFRQKRFLISRFVKGKSRKRDSVFSWRDAEICNAISSYNGRVFEEKKRKNLAVLAKTSRLKRFFPAELFKQQR